MRMIVVGNQILSIKKANRLIRKRVARDLK